MTRRVGVDRGRVVPGLSDAIADYARWFAEAWPTSAALARAEAAERGQPLELDGPTIWRALFRVNSPLARRFEHDENTYTVTAPDALAQATRP